MRGWLPLPTCTSIKKKTPSSSLRRPCSITARITVADIKGRRLESPAHLVAYLRYICIAVKKTQRRGEIVYLYIIIRVGHAGWHTFSTKHGRIVLIAEMIAFCQRDSKGRWSWRFPHSSLYSFQQLQCYHSSPLTHIFATEDDVKSTLMEFLFTEYANYQQFNRDKLRSRPHPSRAAMLSLFNFVSRYTEGQ